MKSIVRTYIYIHYWLLTRFNIRIKGLGKIQRILRMDFVFNAFKKSFYYKAGIEGSYDYLLIGKSNEPETHLFFNKVIPGLDRCSFIDVGASVGEFVFANCNFKNIDLIYAFEPRPDCAEVLRKNIELNNESRVKLFENIVSNEKGEIALHLNAGGTSSGIYNQDFVSKDSVKVKAVALDDVLPEYVSNPIILVDVEGAEPLVLKSAVNFITKNNPLIIFEYNNTSKKHFQLHDIENILSEKYSIYRIKSDGCLDKDFSNSWNCVAIPAKSKFEDILRPSIFLIN